MENLKRFLLEHAFFEGIEPHLLDIIVGCASNAMFKKGEVILREGDEANAFYVIRSGKVGIEIPYPGHGSMLIQTLGEGEVFGWEWLIPPHRWYLGARALEDAKVLVFNGACLREKCEENKDMGYEMMRRFSRIITQRLHSARKQILDLAQMPRDAALV